MRHGSVNAAAIFIVSIFVHFLWEALQSFGYGLHGLDPYAYILICFRATLGDASYMLLFYVLGWAVFRSPDWIGGSGWRGLLLTLVLGLAVGTWAEWRALAAGTWSYSPAMPLIPGLGVGLLPVLQMAVLPSLIFWATARLVRWPPASGSKDGP